MAEVTEVKAIEACLMVQLSGEDNQSEARAQIKNFRRNKPVTEDQELLNC